MPGRHRAPERTHGRSPARRCRRDRAGRRPAPAGAARRRCAARSCSAAPTTPTWSPELARLRGRRGGRAWRPPPAAPDRRPRARPVRVAIDYADAAELAAKAGKAVKALAAGQPGDVEGAARPGHLRRRGARRPRSRSSTPARARSTSTCCADLRARGADRRRRRSTRPTGS